jgi:hypothetical protein
MRNPGFKAACTGVAVAAAVVLVASVASVGTAFNSGAARDEGDENPCRGLTDEECIPLQQDMSAAFDARLAAWVKQFNGDEERLQSLPRRESMADYQAPVQTLDASVDAADLIVLATAREIGFDAHYARVELDVENVLKGDSPPELTVTQGGGPRPSPDWKSGSLVSAPADPLLLPGDRAVLFLKYSEPPGWWEAQAWTGQYRIGKDDTIAATDLNPFGAAVEGSGLNEFLQLIESSAR